jgi:O-antigen ligase
MLMGFCGVVAFVAALFIAPSFKVFRNRVLIVLVAVFSFIIWLTQSEKGQILMEGASTFYYYKLGTDGGGVVEKEGGDQERLYYYFSVGEVFLKNPFFGVSYNGFGPAVSNTKAHESGKMSDEDSFVNANPHNAFLYYISANGILGWVMAAMIYLLFLFIFYRFFIPFGISGFVISFSIMLASLIHTNTLIGFFNTTVMYLPTAVALSTLERKNIFKQFNKTQSLTV